MNDPEAPDYTELPKHFLSSVSLYVMLGIFCVAGVYALHWQFPVFLNVFYTDIDNVEIRTVPFIAACVIFPVLIPVMIARAFRNNTVQYMFTFMLVFAVVLGTAFAFVFVPLQWNFILLALLVLALSHWVYAILTTITEDLSEGKFARSLLFGIALTMMFAVAGLLNMRWPEWCLTLVLFLINIIGHNVGIMRARFSMPYFRNLSYNQQVLGEAFGRFIALGIFLFPHITFTNLYRSRKRESDGKQ